MEIRYPRRLRPADIIGVTAPSSGISKQLQGRLDFAVQQLRDRGFVVQVGDCLDGTSHISAPVKQRAEELIRMLLDRQSKPLFRHGEAKAPST